MQLHKQLLQFRKQLTEQLLHLSKRLLQLNEQLLQVSNYTNMQLHHCNCTHINSASTVSIKMNMCVYKGLVRL